MGLYNILASPNTGIIVEFRINNHIVHDNIQWCMKKSKKNYMFDWKLFGHSCTIFRL